MRTRRSKGREWEGKGGQWRRLDKESVENLERGREGKG